MKVERWCKGAAETMMEEGDKGEGCGVGTLYA